MNVARQIVMQRFATNSVAGHLAQSSMVARNETTFQSDRFDFAKNQVADRETFGLYEPFALCKLTRAQVDELVSGR